MKILGIETSCDETAMSILEFDSNEKVEILADEVSSQVNLHKEYGGVVPELAAREHLDNLPKVFELAFKKANIQISDIDLIAVTQGPGLKGCLLMGFCYAQGLSALHNIKLIGINHIEGHLFSSFFSLGEKIEFPFLSLSVSGVHTELVLVEGFAKYKILARTIDDAAGEAFDKSANLLGFEYPGGPDLAKLADTVSESRFELPKVMRQSEDFSFSGLKTAIAQLVKKNKASINELQIKAEICFSIQDSIVDSLVHKTRKALNRYDVKYLSLVGGVSANSYLKKKLKEIIPESLKFISPKKHHCTDNAAMIAFVGGLRRYQELEERVVYSRWPIEKLAPLVQNVL